jgi:glutamate carboxypeptidase
MTFVSDGARLLNYFSERNQEILQLVKWLVEQESMSREVEPLKRIGSNYGDKLASIGGQVDLLTDPHFGTTVRARFGPAPRNGLKQLLVVGHLDTVWPLGTLNARPFRVEADRAYGPGVFDMKAGVAVATFAVKALNELGRAANRPVTLLMTCDEETGSHFSREVIEDEARSAEAALVLEPPIPGGKVKTARKGVGEFELIVHGRSAHAGNDPRAGVSAITEIANQVLFINKLCDFSKGTTLNVGVVRGGVLSNVVAAEARASIDLRYQTEDEGERITKALNELNPFVEGARLEVKGGINRPPLVRTAEVGKLFEHARTLAAEFGYELKEGAVGGGSDGNFIAALGVPVLDGLGVDGAGAHAEHEHIIIDDIPRRAAIVTRLIETV